MPLPWIPLTTVEEIERLKDRSFTVPCLILKHSTSCNISAIAQYRLNDDWDFAGTTLEPYYLDLLRFRPVSRYIADAFEVYHESPQILLIINGECVYDASHLDISVAELKEALLAEATK
ncbi:MAG: bacillithiol system redox-active protein YtxJ [Saprospiraceae bacterium]